MGEHPQPLDLPALETVAREAAEHLPGEWRINTDEAAPSTVAFLDRHAGEERWLAFAHCSGGCLEWISASDHIATFDPPTVLRLIEQHRELLAQARAVVARWDTPLWKDAEPTALVIAGLRAAIAMAEAGPMAEHRVSDPNVPERLAYLLKLAGELHGADLNRSDDAHGQRGHYEFADLGQEVERWLNAGRPADGAEKLEQLAEAVDAHEWGQLWTDPGDYPSNAGAGPLPDRWTIDSRPNELARDLLVLLDDMDLLPKPVVTPADDEVVF